MDELTGEGMAEAAALAGKLSQDRRLRGAMAGLLKGDAGAARFALTAPREFLAAAGVELPDHLDITIVRGDERRPTVPGKFGPDFEFFVIRQFDCRTYWVATFDEDGRFVEYEEQTICWGFEITPRFIPGGPIS